MLFRSDSIKIFYCYKNDSPINWFRSDYLYKYEYNEKLLENEFIILKYDKKENSYKYYQRELSDYNDNNYKTYYTYQEYFKNDSDDYWQYKSRKVYHYTDKNDIIEEIFQSFKIWGSFQYWVDVSKTEFYYDSLSRIVERKAFGNDEYSSDWLLQNRDLLIYNVIENSIVEEKQDWISESNYFRNRIRTKIIKDLNNDTIQYFTSKGISDSLWEPWSLQYKKRYVYNEFGKLKYSITYLTKLIDTLITDIDYDTTKYFYDINQNLIEKCYSSKYSGNGWDISYQYLFKYDTDNNLAEELYTELEWEVIRKKEYVYKKVTNVNNINKNNSNCLLIYPNPTQDILYINSSNNSVMIEIYSLMGVKVLESKYIDKINVSHLPSGIYFIIIGNKVEKFVKM